VNHSVIRSSREKVEQIQDHCLKKEERNMKGIVAFMKKSSMHLGSGFLAAVAVFFASVACVGHFHEAEVPESLK
jgi:cyclic lactone autoinducer peptide